MAALGFELYKTRSAAELRRAFALLVRNPTEPGEYTRVCTHIGVTEEMYRIGKRGRRARWNWRTRRWVSVAGIPAGIYMKETCEK